MTDTRDDFERHFKPTIRQQKRHTNGDYRDPSIQAKWLGWQAGVANAAPAAVPDRDGDALRLAARLKMSITYLGASLAIQGEHQKLSGIYLYEGDVLAATRRAIEANALVIEQSNTPM